MGSDVYRGTLFYITHHTATEDVVAVDSLDIHGGSFYRVVESATKDSAAEDFAVSFYVGIANHLSGVATTHDIHHGITAQEVHVFFALLDSIYVTDVVAISFHVDVHMGITLDDGIFTISATEYAEVRGSHLIIYLLPFIGFEEAIWLSFYLLLFYSHLGIFMQQSLFHGEMGIFAYHACYVSTGIDVVVDLELQCLVIVLRRVGGTCFWVDVCRFPGTGISQPVGGEHCLSTLDIYVGVTLYVCRGDNYFFLIVYAEGITTAQASAIDAMTYFSVIEGDEGVAVYRSVLATAIDFLHQQWQHGSIRVGIRMLHVLI